MTYYLPITIQLLDKTVISTAIFWHIWSPIYTFSRMFTFSHTFTNCFTHLHILLHSYTYFHTFTPFPDTLTPSYTLARFTIFYYTYSCTFTLRIAPNKYPLYIYNSVHVYVFLQVYLSPRIWTSTSTEKILLSTIGLNPLLKKWLIKPLEYCEKMTTDIFCWSKVRIIIFCSYIHSS